MSEVKNQSQKFKGKQKNCELMFDSKQLSLTNTTECCDRFF